MDQIVKDSIIYGNTVIEYDIEFTQRKTLSICDAHRQQTQRMEHQVLEGFIAHEIGEIRKKHLLNQVHKDGQRHCQRECQQ